MERAIVVVVAALSMSMSVAGCSSSDESAAPTPSHSTNPASKPISDVPTSPSPDRPHRKPFEVDLPGTQRRWDPRTVDELPHAPPGTIPGLPTVVEPPDAATPLVDAPIDAAVLVVRKAAAALLLSTEGEWRSVPLTSRYSRVALSPEGTRLVTVANNRRKGGVVAYSLGSGESHSVPYPARFGDWEYRTWLWMDEDTLFLQDFGEGWVVDPVTGKATETTFPGTTLSWSFDPAGDVVASADWGSPRIFTDWASGRPREVSMRTTGRLSSVRADAGTVVGTSYDGHPFAVIVADRSTLTPRAVLPLREPEADYSNWGLGVAALRDDGTVLLSVAAIGRHVDGARLVAWEPSTGDLSVVSTHNLPIHQSVTVAEGLLRRTDP